MNPYFDYVVTIDDVENPKPNPDPLLKVCSLARVDVKDALFLGDTAFDIECASKAHVDFGLAMWGAHEKCVELCDIHFEHPSDVINY
ncbi:HAD family hydrolase [Intestinibacter sp.]